MTGKNLTNVAAPSAKSGDPKFLMRACEQSKGNEAYHEHIDMPGPHQIRRLVADATHRRSLVPLADQSLSEWPPLIPSSQDLAQRVRFESGNALRYPRHNEKEDLR